MRNRLLVMKGGVALGAYEIMQRYDRQTLATALLVVGESNDYLRNRQFDLDRHAVTELLKEIERREHTEPRQDPRVFPKQKEVPRGVPTHPGSHDGIVCNRFKLISDIQGNELRLKIDSDLPDEAVIIVSVSRRYRETDSTAIYSFDYFEEKSPLRIWRTRRSIVLDSDR